MWDPRRLTTLWVFTAWYRDSFTLLMPISLNGKEFCRNFINFTPSEVLKMVTRKITIQWYVTPCSLAETCMHFGGMYFFHFQIRIVHPSNKKADSKQSWKIILITYFEIRFVFFMSYTRPKPIKNNFISFAVSRWARFILWSSEYQTTWNHNRDCHIMIIEFDEHISVQISCPKFNRNLFNIFWYENCGLRVSYNGWILFKQHTAFHSASWIFFLSCLLVGHTSSKF
jgi:hypothetical protein